MAAIGQAAHVDGGQARRSMQDLVRLVAAELVSRSVLRSTSRCHGDLLVLAATQGLATPRPSGRTRLRVGEGIVGHGAPPPATRMNLPDAQNHPAIRLPARDRRRRRSRPCWPYRFAAPAARWACWPCRTVMPRRYADDEVEVDRDGGDAAGRSAGGPGHGRRHRRTGCRRTWCRGRFPGQRHRRPASPSARSSSAGISIKTARSDAGRGPGASNVARLNKAMSTDGDAISTT